jgi:hypothetical protein
MPIGWLPGGTKEYDVALTAAGADVSMMHGVRRPIVYSVSPV